MGSSQGRVQRTRTRKETLRTLLLGLRAMADQGAFFHTLSLEKADPTADVRARADRIAAASGEAAVRKRAPKKRGRPSTHRTKPGETEAEYERRLARNRQQKRRAKLRAEKRTKR